MIFSLTGWKSSIWASTIICCCHGYGFENEAVLTYKFCLRKSSTFLQESSWAQECATISPPHRANAAGRTGNSELHQLLVLHRWCHLVSKLTFLSHYCCSEGGGSEVGRVRRFDQVTGVWVRQDGQQVTVPSSLHHFFHLERRSCSFCRK